MFSYPAVSYNKTHFDIVQLGPGRVGRGLVGPAPVLLAAAAHAVEAHALAQHAGAQALAEPARLARLSPALVYFALVRCWTCVFYVSLEGVVGKILYHSGTSLDFVLTRNFFFDVG